MSTSDPAHRRDRHLPMTPEGLRIGRAVPDPSVPIIEAIDAMQTRPELTPAQQDIFLEGKLFGWVVNNIGGYQVYRCPLDATRFRRARDRLLSDNDAYRLRFDGTGGGCEPFLSDAPPPELPVVVCATEASALAWVEARIATPFADLSTEVFEDALLRIDDGVHWYYAKAHHLIMDGWGFALQMQRLLGMYVGDDATGARDEDETAAPPSMVEYMRRQSDYRRSPQYANSRDYWLSRHDAPTAPLFPRHGPPVAASARASQVLAPSLIAALRALAATAKSDLAVVLYAALYVCFSRTCQRREIVVGSPVHNRRTAIDKAIIGSIVNVNLHRFDATPDMPFAALLGRVAAALRQDHRHGRFPMGDLLRALRVKHGAAGHAAHDIAFNYQKLDFGLSLHGRPVETHFLSHAHERVPLTFVLCEYGSQDLRLHLDYALDCFDAAQARDTLERVVHLLRQVADDGARPIGAYPLLLPAEQRDQFVHWQGAEVPLRQGARLHDFFEEQVRRGPERVAASCGQASLTYAELNRRANLLAHRLIAHGIGPGGMVGVCHGRSLGLLIALLAVSKSGAAYVPIDPGYPAPRIRHILDDARPAIVIADGRGADALGGFAGVLFRTDAAAFAAAVKDGPDAADPARPATGSGAEDVAYVIYTSGSTGRPKGVLIEHRNAAAFVQWALAHYPQADLSVVLAATSICFDLSIFEIFVTLAAGGRIALVENVLALRDRAIDGLSLINTVPSAIRGLLEADAVPRDLRCINLAGELLHQDLVEALYARLPAAKVYDLYGPSETTTYSTVCLRRPGGAPLIGKPIHNTRIHVLDDAGDPLPTGAIGELHIGGAGLARGYLNQPALTAERFVFNRHADAMLYRTGDLARWMPDGSLQYRGRRDHQEKIRGFRVEPGEIEACLREHPAVADCVVVGRDPPDGAGPRYLAAYIVAAVDDAATADPIGIEALAAFVAARLPAHAVPSRFAILPALPLTPNGKVDRAALPDPGDAPRVVADRAPPRDDTERRLAALWSATLQQDGIGIHDSFLSRGGDSLHFLGLASAIEREFDVRIELPLLFATPTIEAQARLIAEHGALERLRQAVTRDPRDARSDNFIDL